MNEHLRKIEFSSMWQRRVGGLPLVFGLLTRDENGGAVVMAAALSERDLHTESCGYGTTESEAAADLFRLIR